MGHKYQPDIQSSETKGIKLPKGVEQLCPKDYPMAFKTESMNPHDITTRRLVSIYISKMMHVNTGWAPNVDSVWKCYEFINDAVLYKLNGGPGVDISQGIDKDYADYFMTEDPGHIKSVIGREFDMLKEIRRANC